MIKMITFILAGTLIYSQIVLAQDNFDATRLPGLEACYPDWEGYFEGSELVSQAKDKEKEYFLIHLYQPNTDAPDPLVISRLINGGECKQEFLSITGDDISLSKVLSNVQIGRELKLGLYQKELDSFGKKGLQDRLNQVAEVNSRWHEEDMWALEQLGLSIPENVVAIEE